MINIIINKTRGLKDKVCCQAFGKPNSITENLRQKESHMFIYALNLGIIIIKLIRLSLLNLMENCADKFQNKWIVTWISSFSLTQLLIETNKNNC